MIHGRPLGVCNTGMKCNHPPLVRFNPAQVAPGGMRPKAVLTKNAAACVSTTYDK